MTDLATTGPGHRSFCTFRLGQRLHGIEVLHVREVSRRPPATPVPQAPPAVHGLVNLRSRIYVALDLRPLLGMLPLNFTDESRFIILKPDVGQDLGILVEQGGDIAHVRADQIDLSARAGDSPGDIASPLVAGVCRLDSELMIIVDPTRINEAVLRVFDKATR